MNAKNGDLAVQRIAVVVVSPFTLAVKVGEAFASLVSDPHAFSDWREVVVGAMWIVVWRKVFVHDPRPAKLLVCGGESGLSARSFFAPGAGRIHLMCRRR